MFSPPMDPCGPRHVFAEWQGGKEGSAASERCLRHSDVCFLFQPFFCLRVVYLQVPILKDDRIGYDTRAPHNATAPLAWIQATSRVSLAIIARHRNERVLICCFSFSLVEAVRRINTVCSLLPGLPKFQASLTGTCEPRQRKVQQQLYPHRMCRCGALRCKKTSNVDYVYIKR